MKNFSVKLAPLLLLIFLVCACQPPELHHMVVNTTDENLSLKYKLAICGSGDSWGSWIPETQSEESFKNAGAWTSLRAGEYALEKGKETGKVPNSSLKANCDTETYLLNVAPHTAVKIHRGDYAAPRALNLLELDGSKGKIKYEGAALQIMENFKSYSNDWFNFFGPSLAVLWY